MYLPIWFLIALSFWLRIWGSFHDGLCDRGTVFTMKDTSVGWISWHVVNWMRRDIVITLLYALVIYKFIAPAARTNAFWLRLILSLVALGGLALMHKYLHRWLYNWALGHREKFLRGPVKTV